MGDAVQVKSFRQEPVHIKIGTGDKTRQITVGDLPYKKHQELLKEIGKVLIQRDAFPVILNGIERSVQGQMLKQGKTADEAISTFIEKIAELYMNLNGSTLYNLLELASNGEITEADQDLIGSDESTALLMWLLDRRFMSLKNLYASLTTILSATMKTDQK